MPFRTDVPLVSYSTDEVPISPAAEILQERSSSYSGRMLSEIVNTGEPTNEAMFAKDQSTSSKLHAAHYSPATPSLTDNERVSPPPQLSIPSQQQPLPAPRVSIAQSTINILANLVSKIEGFPVSFQVIASFLKQRGFDIGTAIGQYHPP